MAEAADGYRVAFAPGDLDPLLGDQAVVVAATCNGKPLPSAEGPLRLLADGDRRGARAVHRLVALRVVELGK
jgi:DMSO/TMAO reductase YedYZ molybdopterin-dependent catalytic subunit